MALAPGVAYAAAPAPDSSGPVARVLTDAGALTTAPLGWDARAWGLAAFAAAGGVALYQYDVDIRDYAQRHRGSVGDRVGNLGNALGDGFYVLPVLAGAALVGHAADRPKLEATGLTALEAVVFSGGATVVLKSALGRARPKAGLGPHDWSGPRAVPDLRLSFPSGHVSTAFSAAAVIARAYPGTPVPYVAYGAATVTAFARVEKDAHWASDVWGGAAIGLWVGHTLAGRHPPPGGPDLALVPLPGGAEALLTWHR
jgi:membrane-associated phospholipid phosphatase